MRVQLFGATLLFLVIPMSVGCQQTNAPITSPLTPTNPYAASSQLAPVQRTSAIGPLGGSTRVPPPATNSYTVPNNYMGGTAPVGSTSANQQPYNGLSNNAPLQSNINPAGWVQKGSLNTQSFGGAFGNSNPVGIGQAGANQNSAIQNGSLQQYATQDQQLASSTLRPQLNGMRVHDLTKAPTPPGYAPQIYAPQSNQLAGNQYSGNQYVGNQPAGYQAPSVYTNSGGFVDRNIAPTSYVAPITNQANPAINQGTRIATVPFGSDSSSGNGATAPSTEPVNTNLSDQTDQLRWRRPTSQY